MKQNIAKDNNRDDFIKVWDVCHPIRWTNLSVVSPKTGLFVIQRQIGKNRVGVFKIPMEDTVGAEYDFK